MKTAEEIIRHLENEKVYCFRMYERYQEKDTANSFQYLIRLITIESLLAEIKE